MNADFEKLGYVLLENFIPPEVAELAYRYATMRIELGYGKLPPDQLGARGEYGDHLMETLLEQIRPKMEGITGRRLWPTYAYYRLYRAGMELKKHRDRPACEYSVSVCLGRTHTEDWALFANGSSLPCPPGSGVVYKGCEVEHWREPLLLGEQVQVFFHFVDRDGIWGDVCRYDTRPGLGFPAASKKMRPEDMLRLDQLRKEHNFSASNRND